MTDYQLMLWSAARVTTEHAAGGRCPQCTTGQQAAAGPGPCPLWVWADTMLRLWEQRGGEVPEPAPSWRAVERWPGHGQPAPAVGRATVRVDSDGRPGGR